MNWPTFWQVLSVADALLVAAAIIAVLRRPREPRAMLAWILTLLLLPVFGLVLFLILGEPRMERTRRQRARHRERLDQSFSAVVEPRHTAASESDPGPRAPTDDIVRLATNLSGHPPSDGNAVTIYHEDEDNFNAILQAVEDARHHVHLEYYIFQPDETGRQLRDLLIDRVRAGIQVRLLVDYVGAWRWPRGFARSFRDGGVDLAYFMPVVPWRGRWRVNFRNHRKILIVDGATGFTGSQNIGDEYRGRLARYGPWRDTHLRITGPAVHRLQEIFVEDWHYATRDDLVQEAYFPEPAESGTQRVQVIPSGPDANAHTMHLLLTSAMAAARRSVAVLTPYFAPDAAMMIALQSAAYRGLKVQLLVPACSNHKVTLWAGRSFYAELAGAGVEIFEYSKTMLHSKVVIVDDHWATVGSANMDQRSFRLNFEVTTILYDNALATNLQADFDRLIHDAKPIRAARDPAWSFADSLKLGLARLVSPVI